MKQIWLTVLLSSIFTGLGSAQNTSIIKELNSDKTGQGDIVIYQDESIEGLIGTKNTSASTTLEHSSSNNVSTATTGSTNTTGLKASHYIQTKGYKIQVFSGNDQKRSKSEAQARKNAIERSFPDTEVVITFNSPVWRVRAGNYRTYEQAFEALKEIRNTFPSFGREMEIKEAVVKLPVY